MPGAHELQLISRYFGTPSRLCRNLTAGANKESSAKLGEEATITTTTTTTSSGKHHHAHIHHGKAKASQKQAAVVTDEELMQVMFSKLKSSKFHGPDGSGSH